MPLIGKQDITPCSGTKRQPNCGLRADPAIKGFDDKWRCRRCHAVHVELVYAESGDTNPTTGKSRWVAAVESPEVTAMRQRILNAARDTDTPISEMPAHLKNKEGWDHANKVAKESVELDSTLVSKGAPIVERAAAHAAILTKYGVGKPGGVGKPKRTK